MMTRLEGEKKVNNVNGNERERKKESRDRE